MPMPAPNKDINPVDPNVKIPAAILAQSQAADDLHKQVYTAPEGGDPQQPEVQPQPPVTPEGGESGPKFEALDASVTQQVSQQIIQPAEPDPLSAPPPRSPKVENGSLEQKYWSIYARLQSVTEELRIERDNNNALRGMLATFQSAPPADPQQRADSLLTDQDRADWGEDLLTVVGKKSRDELLPIIQGLKNEITQLKAQQGQVAHQVARSTRQDMLDYLTDKCPSWRQINHDDNFLDWLDLTDEFSGVTRKKLLNEAFEANNSPRVLAFFTGYLRENPPAPAPSDLGQQQAKPSSPAPKTSLADLAAPGRAKTAAAPNAPAPDKPIYTQDQIRRFYADSAAGKYRGREEEKNRIEQDIFLAQSEGRIQ